MHQHCHLLSRMFYCERHFPWHNVLDKHIMEPQTWQHTWVELQNALWMKHLGPCLSTAWAHCLNPCLQMCASTCYCGREALALTSELASLIHAIFDTLHERMWYFIWFYNIFVFQILNHCAVTACANQLVNSCLTQWGNTSPFPVTHHFITGEWAPG